jgi:DNA-binding NtrC family response regulator
MANFILVDLVSETGAALARALRAEHHSVRHAAAGSAAVFAADVDVAFCNGDHPNYPVLIRRMHHVRPERPVVVVTRLPEARQWLDALEAGAADYCGAPFEPVQIRRLVASVLAHREKAYAA